MVTQTLPQGDSCNRKQPRRAAFWGSVHSRGDSLSLFEFEDDVAQRFPKAAKPTRPTQLIRRLDRVRFCGGKITAWP